LDVGLAEIGRLRPVSFSWIDNPGDGQHYGLVAQEVAEVLPEIVSGGGQLDQPLGMNYAEVVPVLVNAIQEQQAQIESQEDQIDDLEARLAAIEGAEQTAAGGSYQALAPILPWMTGFLLAAVMVVLGRRRLGGAS
jgi:hypothetical protein